MKPVYEYIDYRRFLDAFYQEKKRQSRHFSFRFFSARAQIRSPSFLKHVIDGKRNLTRPVTERLCGVMGLSPREALYFKNLVLFNQAQTALEKQEHYAVLRSMAGSVKEHVLQTVEYDYFDKWYTPAIRELVCLHDFRDDFEALGKILNPPVSASEARKAVESLLKLKLIDRRADGTYRQAAIAIAADSTITSLALRSFVETMLGLAQKALHAVDKKERHISSLTMSVSPATYQVVTAEVEAFKDRLKSIVSRDAESSRVYEMTIAVFPLSADVRRPDAAGKGVGA